jgi:hypothetical protein
MRVQSTEKRAPKLIVYGRAFFCLISGSTLTLFMVRFYLSACGCNAILNAARLIPASPLAHS